MRNLQIETKYFMEKILWSLSTSPVDPLVANIGIQTHTKGVLAGSPYYLGFLENQLKLILLLTFKREADYGVLRKIGAETLFPLVRLYINL